MDRATHAVFDIAADLDTPVSAFLKLAAFSPRFLLESVEGGERLARYSFLGFGDALQVRIEAGSIEPGVAGLLRELRRGLEKAPRPRARDARLPFEGGLVGVASYEIVRSLEASSLPRTAEDGAPLALYLGVRSVVVFDHLTRRVALLHDGPEEDRQGLRREVIAALRGSLPSRASRGSFAPPAASLTRDAYCAGVLEAQRAIRRGEVYQLVLSSRFSGATDLDPFQVYRALRLLNPSPYLYFLDFGSLQVVGSSPEALVRLDGRQATLRPIAGTRPRGDDQAADLALERELLDDPKEAAEHVMLVDLARNDLGRVAASGTVRVEPYRSVERYSHVMHLVSGVQGVLRSGADAFDLFAATFPAGTVVGAPKVRAMQILSELEPVARGLYAGTVGYFAHGGGMDQAIAIRTLVFVRGAYSYQAGAGIVADSVPEREYAEVLAKGAALEAALRMAQEGL
jgi:anthranilate synthase component 1